MNTTTQTAAILRRLTKSAGRWVGLPALHRASGALAVSTRISNLRERGHRIENRTERRPDGSVASFYRLHIGKEGA